MDSIIREMQVSLNFGICCMKKRNNEILFWQHLKANHANFEGKLSEVLELKREMSWLGAKQWKKQSDKQMKNCLILSSSSVSKPSRKEISYLEVPLEKCCAADMAKSDWGKKGQPSSSLRDLTNKHILIYSRYKNNLLKDSGKPTYVYNCLKTYILMTWLCYCLED